MTKSSRLQSNKKTEENKIKESLLNKKEIDDTAVKDIRNLFRLEKKQMKSQLEIQGNFVGKKTKMKQLKLE